MNRRSLAVFKGQKTYTFFNCIIEGLLATFSCASYMASHAEKNLKFKLVKASGRGLLSGNSEQTSVFPVYFFGRHSYRKLAGQKNNAADSLTASNSFKLQKLSSGYSTLRPF